MNDQYIAHFREIDGKPQTLWDHLQGVSQLTGSFAGKIGLKEQGEIIGLVHDLGKACKEFQNYIASASNLLDMDDDEYVDSEAKKGKIDHATAGSQLVYRNLSSKGPGGLHVGQILSLCIASHHSRSGLIDCLNPNGVNRFQHRIEKELQKTHLEEAWSNLNEEAKQNISRRLDDATLTESLIHKLKSLNEGKEIDHQDTYLFKSGLLIRFLFSCLIDADRLDTADFEMPKNGLLRNHGQYPPWETLINRLALRLQEFENKPDKNEVDVLRSQVSQACLDFSIRPKGIYQLEVPTGGGKTLASMRFALNHAMFHHMDRIIYIIPYTSIIDQNAEEVRKILEDQDGQGQYLGKVVLEHHSNLTPEEETRRQSLLAENWDAPVVFTTQVQFLEALFGAGTSSARRMHQLANSVIIFDEVQTIPVRCVHLFNVALRFLIRGCGSTVVLCTATQPLLNQVEPCQRTLTIPPGNNMIANREELFSQLKRYEVYDRRKIGGWNDEEIADLAIQEVNMHGSALVILNTRNAARSLYQAIAAREAVEVSHLSTNMCPAHRLHELNLVKGKLEKNQPLICVSTQLIEAGVDIDFGSVIRELAGIDSIVQAAGRCNRSGRRKRPGNVFIVNPEMENLDRLRDIKIGRDVAERILEEYKECPTAFDGKLLGLKMVSRFYEYYFFARKDEMKYPVSKNSPVGREDDLFNLLSVNTLSIDEYQRIEKVAPNIPFKQSFQSAAKAFNAIDSRSQGVVVPYEEAGKEIIADLCGADELEKQYRLLKRAQRYSVNLFPNEFKIMADKHAIYPVQEGLGVYYLDGQYYSKQFGWCEEAVRPMDFLMYQGD